MSKDPNKVYKELDEKTFNDIINENFYNEEPRAYLFENSRKLLENGYFYEAHILLQSTWNIGYYRYHQDEILKKLKDKNEKEELKNNKGELNNFKREKELIKKLQEQRYTLKTIPLEDENASDVINNIKELYKIYYDKFGFTGATKAMALELPYLFVMWDNLIVNIIFDNFNKKFVPVPTNNKNCSKFEDCRNKIKNYCRENKFEFKSIHIERKYKQEKEDKVDYLSELYLEFLKVMKATFEGFMYIDIEKPEEYKYDSNNRPLAKKIDEFNYSVITMKLKKNEKDDN